MALDLKDYIATIPDFPKEGILFRDATPILGNADAYQECTAQLAAFAEKVGAEVIVGPEARGFLFGCPVAYKLNLGFVPVRKPGKLPRETISVEYALEYGTDRLEMHADAIKPGQKVVIIDDLLATGGTAKAAAQLVEQAGGVVAGIAFIIELDGLDGAKDLGDYEVCSLMHLSDH